MSDDLRELLRADRAEPWPADVDGLVEAGLRRRRRRHGLVATTSVVVLVAAGVLVGPWISPSDGPPEITDRPSNPTVVQTPSASATANSTPTQLRSVPGAISERLAGGADLAVGFGSAWVATAGGEEPKQVLRLSGDGQTVEAEFEVDATVLAVTDDAVWAGHYPAAGHGPSAPAEDRGWVQRIDPTTNALGERVDLGTFAPAWIDWDGTSLWVATDFGAEGGVPGLVRVDPTTGNVAGPWTWPGTRVITGFALADGRALVVDATQEDSGVLQEVTLPSGAPGPLTVERATDVGGFGHLAVGHDGAWVARQRPPALVHVDDTGTRRTFDLPTAGLQVVTHGSGAIVASQTRLYTVTDGAAVPIANSATVGGFAGMGRDDTRLWVLGTTGLGWLPL